MLELIGKNFPPAPNRADKFSYNGIIEPDVRGTHMTCLNGIDIDVTAVIGSTMLPIREIVKMGRGAMIQLDCSQAQVEQCRRNTQGTRAGKYLILLGVGLGAKPDVLTTFCL